MSQPKKARSTGNSFFKPIRPPSRLVTPSSQQPVRKTSEPPASLPHNSLTGPRADPPGKAVNAPRPVTASTQQSCSSSLSPPPASPVQYDGRQFDISMSPPKPLQANSAPGRIVKGSDDEEDDSDSELEDLNTIFQTKHPVNMSKSIGTPSTPHCSRVSKPVLTSPIPLLSKHKFDIQSLASHAENERKSEASSKRIKAMQDASHKEENVPLQGKVAISKLKHSETLQSVIGDQEGTDIQKVIRAVMRTEATLTEQRWYFFSTQSTPPKPSRRPFPANAVTEEWKSDLSPQMRTQTLVSGFAEDMVSIGQLLPDEILLWMLDELCMEPSEPLRTSYCNILQASSEQVERLVVPNVMQKMFERVGATSTGMNISEKVQPIPALPDPYAKRDWAKLLTVLKLFSQIAPTLAFQSHVLLLLLRMSLDRVVLDTIDIFAQTQETLTKLCQHIPTEIWELEVDRICTTLCDSITHPVLRLQIIHTIPSTPPTHDLKRRLAMCFYFNSLEYATQHSHRLLNLDAFINRLDDKDFDTNAETDYRDLGALISLLDVAVDDGRNVDVDFSTPEAEEKHDKDIEELGATIKHITKSIGNPGAAFVSRIEAKEVSEVVSQRIVGTLRLRAKKRCTVFDRKDSLEGEKRGMASFVNGGVR